MWSGPRSISTAMMRSWGNRGDTFVCDEPFYAHYLHQTRLPHPGAEETIAQHETDWPKVVEWLTGPIPAGKSVFYQKHMAHHLLPEIGLEWLDDVTNCFLIRDPIEMLTSLVEFIPQPRIDDTGLPQQVQIFDLVRDSQGESPSVLDARDVLQNPRAMLSLLCETLDLEFTEAMLQWPAGLRDTDGVWAKHWYKKVEDTTSFATYKPKTEPVPDSLLALLDECYELYNYMHQFRLTI
jgi:hypothetical protein